VCQIHTKAVLQLRAKLADRPEAAGRRPAVKTKSPRAPTGGAKATGTSDAGAKAPRGAASAAKTAKRVPTSATG